MLTFLDKVLSYYLHVHIQNIFIIFRSLTVTDADEELFEDNPEEYIRRDIEGSGNTQTHAHVFLCYFYTILL